MKKNLYFILLLASVSSCQQNPMGTASTIASNFHPGMGTSPKILSISPDRGPFVGGTNITLTGTGFTSESKIKIGGKACSQTTFHSATRIVCLTPQHTMGLKDIFIENKDGQKQTLAQAFTYASNVSGTPGFGILSGGKASSSASLTMQSAIGEPLQGDVMTGPTTQLKVGVSGILFAPAD